MARSHGGLPIPDNLVLECADCNLTHKDINLYEYMYSQGRRDWIPEEWRHTLDIYTKYLPDVRNMCKKLGDAKSYTYISDPRCNLMHRLTMMRMYVGCKRSSLPTDHIVVLSTKYSLEKDLKGFQMQCFTMGMEGVFDIDPFFETIATEKFRAFTEEEALSYALCASRTRHPCFSCDNNYYLRRGEWVHISGYFGTPVEERALHEYYELVKDLDLSFRSNDSSEGPDLLSGIFELVRKRWTTGVYRDRVVEFVSFSLMSRYPKCTPNSVVLNLCGRGSITKVSDLPGGPDCTAVNEYISSISDKPTAIKEAMSNSVMGRKVPMQSWGGDVVTAYKFIEVLHDTCMLLMLDSRWDRNQDTIWDMDHELQSYIESFNGKKLLGRCLTAFIEIPRCEYFLSDEVLDLYETQGAINIVLYGSGSLEFESAGSRDRVTHVKFSPSDTSGPSAECMENKGLMWWMVEDIPRVSGTVKPVKMPSTGKEKLDFDRSFAIEAIKGELLSPDGKHFVSFNSVTLLWSWNGHAISEIVSKAYSDYLFPDKEVERLVISRGEESQPLHWRMVRQSQRRHSNRSPKSRIKLLNGAIEMQPDWFKTFNLVPGILPVKNKKIVDLTTGKVRQRKASDKCRGETPVEYDRSVGSKRMELYLSEILKAEDIGRLQLEMGHMLIGRERAKLLYLYNISVGSDTLMNLLSESLGPYTMSGVYLDRGKPIQCAGSKKGLDSDIFCFDGPPRIMWQEAFKGDVYLDREQSSLLLDNACPFSLIIVSHRQPDKRNSDIMNVITMPYSFVDEPSKPWEKDANRNLRRIHEKDIVLQQSCLSWLIEGAVRASKTTVSSKNT